MGISGPNQAKLSVVAGRLYVSVKDKNGREIGIFGGDVLLHRRQFRMFDSKCVSKIERLSFKWVCVFMGFVLAYLFWQSRS